MNDRTSCFALVLTLLPALAYQWTASASEEEMAAIRELAAAAEKGPEALLTHVREKETRAPVIYSQWYVDRLARESPKKAELEQARRDFGKTVLKSLEATSAALLEPSDTKTREHMAEVLLDLADWFGEPPGYGNALLFWRCQNMATVPLAHLIADLSYPEEALVTMVGRLIAFPEEVKRNVRVLNQEAPEPVFAAPQSVKSCVGVWDVMERARRGDRIVAPLQWAWYRKVHEIHKWHKGRRKSRFLTSGKDLRDQLPEDLAFFCDDAPSLIPKPFTTLKQWDKKYHRRLFLGLGSRNIRNVRAFLLFRRKVRSFPTKPPAWWKPGDSVLPTPTEAAFSEAWIPFRGELGTATYSPAAKTYVAVQRNTFYDEDTRQTKQHEAFERANEALKAQNR